MKNSFVNPFVNLLPTTSRTHQSALEKMLEVVNTAENGVCISGFGYDSSLVDEHLELDKDLLDSVSKTNPLFVVNQSEHLAYLDSEAYKRTSIDDSTTDPHYFKRDGKLTGVVAEANWTSCLISSSHPFREICCLGWRISGKLDGQVMYDRL